MPKKNRNFEADFKAYLTEEMKIETIIADYLLHNRRLVVPQLGAFIRKSEGGEVVFSEMLKRDDGVLQALLTDQGVGEIEAAGLISRFVFELRHQIDSGSVFQAEGLGVFARGENGTIRFRHIPSEQPRVAPVAELEPSVEQPVAAPVPVPESESEPIEDSSPVEEASVEEKIAEEATPEELSVEEKRRRIKELMRFEGEHPREQRSSSQPRRHDPSVEGLRYGSPRKSTDAFTYVNSAPSRRPDTFVILAIVAVAIALGAILYGYLKDRRQEQLERQYIEQISAEVAPASELTESREQ